MFKSSEKKEKIDIDFFINRIKNELEKDPEPNKQKELSQHMDLSETVENVYVPEKKVKVKHFPGDDIVWIQ